MRILHPFHNYNLSVLLVFLIVLLFPRTSTLMKMTFGVTNCLKERRMNQEDKGREWWINAHTLFSFGGSWKKDASIFIHFLPRLAFWARRKLSVLPLPFSPFSLNFLPLSLFSKLVRLDGWIWFSLLSYTLFFLLLCDVMDVSGKRDKMSLLFHLIYSLIFKEKCRLSLFPLMREETVPPLLFMIILRSPFPQKPDVQGYTFKRFLDKQKRLIMSHLESLECLSFSIEGICVWKGLGWESEGDMTWEEKNMQHATWEHATSSHRKSFYSPLISW